MQPRIVRYGIFAIVSSCLFIGNMMFGGTFSDDKTAKADGAPNDIAPAKLRLIAIRDCKQCHNADGRQLKGYEEDGVTHFVMMTEFGTWREKDLHSKASENIDPAKNVLAKKMQDILKDSPARKGIQGYRVNLAMECLTCHAADRAWTVDQQTGHIFAAKVDSSMIDQETKGRFHVADGVNCQSCHGVTEVDNWELPHSREAWREKLPKEKLEKGGQLDLRNPQIRSERCASCHVGSSAEGKFVTHEMYAAGHPPLPVLEVASLTHEQPAHYHLSRENKYFNSQADGKKADDASLFARFNFRKNESAEIRMLAYGAIVGFRSSLSLLENTAGGLADFANFDCAACHHDLKSPSERQNRKGGISGRPLMKAQTELLDVVLEHAGNPTGQEKATNQEWEARRTALKQGIAELEKGFLARPFGDAERMKAASEKLLATTDDILKNLGAIVYDQKTIEGLRRTLENRLLALGRSDTGKAGEFIDYDSAQQLVWALLTIHRELQAMMGKKESPEWAAAQDSLRKTISLALREPYNRDEPLASVEKRLKDRLKKQYEFRSDKFFEAIKALADASNKPE